MAFGHGKIILLGEHSVVHGRPAIAIAVERGAEVHAEQRKHGPTTLRLEPNGVDVDTGEADNTGRERLQQALRTARAFYDDGREFALHATMRIPTGSGMGSSAALGVAVLRALDDARGITRPDSEIFERSFAWERVFHGNPGGVDNAMATYGGFAQFKRGEPLQPIVPRHPLKLVVGDSRQERDAGKLIASVARQLQSDPPRIEKLFDAIAALVANGKLALEQGELPSLGQLMTLNHKLLSALLLSTDTLEEMIAAAMDAGALGAKLTGAGGGGCMIALVESEEQRRSVRAALERLGKPVYDVEARGSAREVMVESGT